ncbi:MAG: tRNA 4-thiouridine(8) synthase ThiI, partial [Clostridia bacterium]|nr:tRNA 4-thiouridine(8) synthase ThiI [Clostridia bacterium]
MDKVILVRIGEIALKGLNRINFEQMLAKNMKNTLKKFGACRVSWSQSRFYVEAKEDGFDFEAAAKALCKVFGIVSVSIAYVVESDFEQMKEQAVYLTKKKLDSREYDRVERVKFKVETKRGMKSFPMSSHEVSAEIGAVLLDNFEKLTVDVNNPDFILYVEVREKTYVYIDIIKGQGGMPVGCNGKACLLLSGGIDSPVAGYMISKRGVSMCAVHFHSYPYTSERAKEKVVELAKLISEYCGPIKLMIVPYTEVQLAIHENCRDDLGTVIMRR